ncbi:uncharacterized protein LOC130768882 [Actinidia eriantha]|uniref:uncharacterized protein LOC130768882 n=1 Tax=Actinidia eriantha TaxID=165200 RepID=UPI00258A0CCD|nr:uncharacterized protein LOC130768882 [Actinidia eriantha]
MKLNPPEFIGATDPIVANKWLKKLDTIFEVMEMTEEQKLSLATFMLKGESRNWWEVMRRMHQSGGLLMTWQWFLEFFNDQYFLRIYGTQKEQDFINLKQGRMTVVEYEEAFTTLSWFAPELVCAEDAKCRRFEQGLDLSIRSRVSAFEITQYVELVNKAKLWSVM